MQCIGYKVIPRKTRQHDLKNTTDHVDIDKADVNNKCQREVGRRRSSPPPFHYNYNSNIIWEDIPSNHKPSDNLNESFEFLAVFLVKETSKSAQYKPRNEG